MKTPASLLLALIPLVPACGGSATEDAPGTPSEVAEAFLEAGRTGDRERFLSFFTDGAREGLTSGGGNFSLDEGLESFELGQVLLDGDETRVPVTAQVDGERQDLALCLREENGAWRIWGFDVVVGTETAMTIDLESLGSMMSAMETEMASAFQEAFDQAAMGGSEEDIRAAREQFDAVAAISAKEHEAAWRSNFRSSGEPAGAILGALLTGTGLTLDTEEHAEAFAQSVTLELVGVSRIEAFARVCAAVGLTPVFASATSWENPDLVTFTAGRTSTVAFSGPFMIEAVELEENAPNTTGELTIGVHALGLAPQVLAFQTDMVQTLVIDSIQAPNGESVNGDEGMQFYGTPTIKGAFFTDSTSLDLKSLLSGVQSMTVTGKVKLAFPTEVQESSWNARDEQPRQVGDLTLTRTAWGEAPRFTLKGRSDFEDFDVRLSPLDQSGAPLGVLYTDSSSWGEEMQLGVQAAAPVHSVDMKICRLAELEYPFTLEVPLTRWSEQPAALEPLSFPKNAPLFAEFGRFTERGDFPKVEITLRNEANKDAMDAQTTFTYLDSAGNELESFPHSLSGEFGFEGHAPLAAAGAQATQETTAFFMPDGTAKIRIRIDAVTFADATEWKRPD